MDTDSGGDGGIVACSNPDCPVAPSVYASTEVRAITLWNRRSSSVPTAIQERRTKDWTIIAGRIYAKCAYCGADNGRDYPFSESWPCGRCGKEILLAEEEAANSDTERLDFYSLRPHAVFWNVSQFDGDSGWREAVRDPGRRYKSLREAIDAAKLAARVQGENSQ